ncbi:uncharacterized protein (DUF1330 family) [Pseudonocardia sediminis]|uniref:Uncharacterized protein (DUF1330 family) n=1 Tax=Pseudonocardia sediminis TaxID=1397368 RepID=A0A4Q7V3Y7_PSEST|nr:DUF1330 domain-containing protein [Pseudonocardia sediminis]RZT88181.1 uncharacterized protein (DUF1330 family) [Pseudonocardia sediminis]
MTRAYWVNAFREVHDPEKLAAYVELGAPAVRKAGGRFLARGPAAGAHEAGRLERTTLIEFDSVEAAVAAYESPDYRAALDALGDGAERDIRIVEADEGTTATPGAAHFLSIYRAVHDADKVAAYRELGGPALQAEGGRFVARATASAVFEAGLRDRVVIIEFDDVEAAEAAYASAGYRKALDAFDNGAERDIRIVAPIND